MKDSDVIFTKPLGYERIDDPRTKLCNCWQDNKTGVGIGVCKKCGGVTCTWFGCFIPNHNCKNPKELHRSA